MRNFRLTIEYDGTNYNGWQVQSRTERRIGGRVGPVRNIKDAACISKISNRVRTIQGILEDAIFKLFSKRVRLVSSSRTDSGVHAEGHIANFKVSTKLRPLQIKEALNSLLPDDIVVKSVETVRPDFNAQYDALSKTYRYVICNQDNVSPFIRRYVYHFRQPLDVPIMRREAKCLLGKHDFTAFKSSRGKTSICKRAIRRLSIRKQNGLIVIEIEADGFLHNMVRNIVGTLIEVGRGKFAQGSMKRILVGKDRREAGPTAPANGLCLIDVRYGE